MDLKLYQRQMWCTLKKYLDLTSSKKDKINDKEIDKECLEVLREIILINENQKLALSALRKNQIKCEGETCLVPNPNVEDEEESLLMYNERKDDSTPESKSIDEKDEMETIESRAHSEEINNTNSTSIENESLPLKEEKPVDNLPCFEESEMKINTENERIEDIHDLVTSYEFMQSLGLLTIEECEAVLHNKRERHRRSTFSHIFCQAIWEKQETKRKKRDWLLSSSPPQLRRKIRPGSQPPSRQPSRPNSPLEGGSSSPPSSLSPPSPISPGSFNHNSQNSEEICSSCKGKGASIQCDGCGVHFHSSCVVISDGECCGLSEWLCSKCEKMGMRTSTYNDPLCQRFSRE